MSTKHKRGTMTARQLAEDYLAHQITRDVTRTSTRYHLNQLLVLFGGWQARRVGAAHDSAEPGAYASASYIRSLILAGSDGWRESMPEGSAGRPRTTARYSF